MHQKFEMKCFKTQVFTAFDFIYHRPTILVKQKSKDKHTFPFSHKIDKFNFHQTKEAISLAQSHIGNDSLNNHTEK